MIRMAVLLVCICSSLLFGGCGDNSSSPPGLIQGTVNHKDQAVGASGIEMVLVDGSYQTDTSAGADNSKAILARTVTGEDGRFSFGWMPPGMYGIAPFSNEYLVTAKQSVPGGLFTLGPGEQKQVDFSATLSNMVGPIVIDLDLHPSYLSFNFVINNARSDAIATRQPKLKVYRRIWYLFVPIYTPIAEQSPTRFIPTGPYKETIEFAKLNDILRADFFLVATWDNYFRVDYEDAERTHTYYWDLNFSAKGEYNVTLNYDPVTINVTEVSK